MKIVCGALAALLFCVAGAIWYVYQKKAVFLPALFGLCGFPKIKESCYYDGSGHFRPATKEDKVGFFMQHPIFGGFYHMFFNLEDNALKPLPLQSTRISCRHRAVRNRPTPRWMRSII